MRYSPHVEVKLAVIEDWLVRMLKQELGVLGDVELEYLIV